MEKSKLERNIHRSERTLINHMKGRQSRSAVEEAFQTLSNVEGNWLTNRLLYNAKMGVADGEMFYCFVADAPLKKLSKLYI